MNEKKRKDGPDVSNIGQDVAGEYKLGRLLPPIGATYPDLSKYRTYVDHFDLTDAQKDDLLLTVWRIMQSFVDRAFGDDSTQQARRSGQRLGPVRPIIDLLSESESTKDEKDLAGDFRRNAERR